MFRLTDTQIPAVHDFGLFMALIVSCCWLWVSVLMPAALCIWIQHVGPHEHAWLNWWGIISLLLCDTVFVHAVRHHGRDVIPSAVSLPKLPPSSKAGSCFRACRRATALCQMRMMMWHFCQWRWSQVRLLSLSSTEWMMGGRVSSGCKKLLSRHH